MTPPNDVVLVTTAILLLISVYTDVCYQRIYNKVTVPFAALGLGLNIYGRGAAGILFSLEGILLGLALYFASAFLGRIIGAGDCKLLAAVGALQGWHVLLWCILYTMLAGGVLAVIVALLRGVLKHSVSRVWRSLYMRLSYKTPMDITQAGDKMRLPYAVAIALGTAAALWQFSGKA